MAKLLYKLEISGIIEVKTGLHIGGSDVDLTIGGIDNEVAKHKGEPYIPGSSLAGKLRHLIAKNKGYKDLSSDRMELALLFNGKGYNQPPSINNTGNNVQGKLLAPHTRLLVRDCYLTENNAMGVELLEDKAENFIIRTTGEAKPRHIERVVAGTKFRLRMIMDIYEYDDVKKLCETLHLGIMLLNNDYLGGSGSRGYGEVGISIDKVEKISFVNGSISKVDFKEYNFKKS
jgi:CRISPR-associated protein Csm3